MRFELFAKIWKYNTLDTLHHVNNAFVEVSVYRFFVVEYAYVTSFASFCYQNEMGVFLEAINIVFNNFLCIVLICILEYFWEYHYSTRIKWLNFTEENTDSKVFWHRETRMGARSRKLMGVAVYSIPDMQSLSFFSWW